MRAPRDAKVERAAEWGLPAGNRKSPETIPLSPTGAFFAHSPPMANDEKGATETEVEKIDTIVGSEVLGYEGAGREEHSGENAPTPITDLRGELADNLPEDVE